VPVTARPLGQFAHVLRCAVAVEHDGQQLTLSHNSAGPKSHPDLSHRAAVMLAVRDYGRSCPTA